MTITVPRMEFTVDPWDPGYGVALDHEALGEQKITTVKLDLGIEVSAADWCPISPTPSAAAPGVLLIADGVRRIDARVWTHQSDGTVPEPGIAASSAAGIVRCVPGGGTPATLVAVEVSRSVFSASPDVPDIVTAAATYQGRRASGATMDQLSLALQQHLAQLEVDVAIRYRAEVGSDELLLVDGPLRGRTHLPRTVGYIKTHHTAYLPAPQAGIVSALLPGQRTPVFLMGTNWSRHAWYLRLPVRSATLWAGIVRCEADADLFADEVVALADAVTLLLPSLAGIDYKDPRAPQNLVPIGGLEKLLRLTGRDRSRRGRPRRAGSPPSRCPRGPMPNGAYSVTVAERGSAGRLTDKASSETTWWVQRAGAAGKRRFGGEMRGSCQRSPDCRTRSTWRCHSVAPLLAAHP